MHTEGFTSHIPEVMFQPPLLHAPPVCRRLQQLNGRGLLGAFVLLALALQLDRPYNKALLHRSLHLHSQTPGSSCDSDLTAIGWLTLDAGLKSGQ